MSPAQILDGVFKLRDLGKALDFHVGRSTEESMCIKTGRPYSE